MVERLFHLVQPAGWRAADAAEDWRPPSLAAEGFVHLSFAHQLRGTLEAHFPTGAELWLLELDESRFGEHLRLETSRGGELFPHLHRALRRDEVLGWWKLERDERGRWRLPAFSARLDEPQRFDGAP